MSISQPQVDKLCEFNWDVTITDGVYHPEVGPMEKYRAAQIFIHGRDEIKADTEAYDALKAFCKEFRIERASPDDMPDSYYFSLASRDPDDVRAADFLNEKVGLSDLSEIVPDSLLGVNSAMDNGIKM